MEIEIDFLDMYCLQDECVKNAFRVKVVGEKEVKLKEFNYKVLYGILACNKNLKKWKIKDSDMCDVCDQIQSIEHLLFECNYVKPLWTIINNIFSVNVQFAQILGLDNSFKFNAIVTLVCFLIYKEWLLQSLDGKARTNVIAVMYFKHELNLRHQIYTICKNVSQKYLAELDILINHL